MRLAAEYVLPLRCTDDRGLAELTAYLHRLSRWIDVTVVDGSPPELYARHAAAWGAHVRHMAPALTGGANGKVRGVLTGIALARHERIVLADDDVRHDRATLAALLGELRDADLVAPQNVFRPRPWHARWDTARSLFNRALTGDYPGTYGVRRSVLWRTGGYDADALFENLEMQRTISAADGRVRSCPDLFVTRLPPSSAHFRAQRVRQAYDSFAQPARLLAELALAPTVFALRRRPGILCLLVVLGTVVAERGRRRARGTHVFPRTSALWAPLWLAERGVTSWVAVGLRLRGGVRYSSQRVALAASSLRTLRRRSPTAGRANLLRIRATVRPTPPNS